MGIKQTLKQFPPLYNTLLAAMNATGYFDIRFRREYPRYQPNERWKNRIALVKQSSDNAHIPAVDGAGKLEHDFQRMHNGLKITLGSYYDYGNTRLLEENRGIHEPQEEYVFQEILKKMPAHATMMEFGSYWAFYSLWFASVVKGARNIMVEPDPHKMNSGKQNFKLNGFSGTFDAGFIDDHVDLNPTVPVYSVDHLMKKYNIGFLNILHSDIQGYELKMLHGAKESIAQHKIGYVFISTHSNELHTACRDFLTDHNFVIVSSANLDESYSWDGVLVARQNDGNETTPIAISRRTN